MTKILFPGSFEPIHNGHINMASFASRYFDDSEVIFIPSKNSIWKASSTKPEDKLSMINLAIKDYENFSISTFEIDSMAEQIYTIETVKHFVKQFPLEEIVLLIGADQVNKFHLWKEAEKLSKLVKIAFFNRPGELLEEINIKKYNMIQITGSTINESSTMVREFKSFNVSLDVAKYILQNNLYKLDEIKKFYDPLRFEHAKRVALLAFEIAIKNNVENPWKLFLAGIYHDIGKAYANAPKIMKQRYERYINLPSSLYHQFVGEYITSNNFGINDSDILDAIKFHATGNGNMTVYSKILYAADKIEPGREFDSSKLIAEMNNNFELGFLSVLQANKEYFIKKGIDYNNELTVECFNTYLI